MIVNVDLHSSWLVINSIRGCTNGCKYCFLENHLNISKPCIYCSPSEVVSELLNYRYYDENIPLCLFPNTDIFLNDQNIQYLVAILDELVRRKVRNDLVIITKCLIPLFILDYLQRLQQSGYQIVVYLSYSGLDRKIEPGVNHQDILQNFKMLKKYHIPCIHYFRPFIPQNSSKRKIQKVLQEVHPYTNISVVAGLMVSSETVDKLTFWKDLQKLDRSKWNSISSVYPVEAWKYLFQEYHGDQHIFQTNTCALNMALHRFVSPYCYSKECLFFNSCSKRMRRACRKNISQRNFNILSQKLNYYFQKLHIEDDYTWKISEHHTLQLFGNRMNSKTLTYLSLVLGIKVLMAEDDQESYYSSLNGQPIIYN